MEKITEGKAYHSSFHKTTSDICLYYIQRLKNRSNQFSQSKIFLLIRPSGHIYPLICQSSAGNILTRAMSKCCIRCVKNVSEAIHDFWHFARTMSFGQL